MNDDYGIDSVGELTEKSEIFNAIDKISEFLIGKQSETGQNGKNDESVVSAFLARSVCHLSLENFENAFSDIKSAVLSVTEYNDIFDEIFDKMLPKLKEDSFEMMIIFKSSENDESLQNSFVYKKMFESVRIQALRDKEDESKLKNFILNQKSKIENDAAMNEKTLNRIETKIKLIFQICANSAVTFELVKSIDFLNFLGSVVLSPKYAISLRSLISNEIIFLQNKYKTNLLLNLENICDLMDSVLLLKDDALDCEKKGVLDLKKSVAFIVSSHLLAFGQFELFRNLFHFTMNTNTNVELKTAFIEILSTLTKDLSENTKISLVGEIIAILLGPQSLENFPGFDTAFFKALCILFASFYVGNSSQKEHEAVINLREHINTECQKIAKGNCENNAPEILLHCLYVLSEACPPAFLYSIETPVVLSAVVFSFRSQNVTAANILAAACSSALVRHSLVKAGFHSEMGEIVQKTKKPLFAEPSSDFVSVSVAALLALTKLSIYSAEVRTILFSGQPVQCFCVVDLALNWLTDSKSGNIPFERGKICERLCEALSCLSLHFETKRFLAAEENAKTVDNIITLFESPVSGRMGKFGLVQFFSHLVMTKEDHSSLYRDEETPELNELKKIAEKGIANAVEKSGNFIEKIGDRSGDADDVNPIRRILVSKNLLTALAPFIKSTISSVNNSPASIAPTHEPRPDFYDEKLAPRAPLDGLEGALKVELPLDTAKASETGLAHAFAALLHCLSADSGSRRPLLRQGAANVLLDMAEAAFEPKTRRVSAEALARLLMSANPSCFSEAQVARAGRALLYGLGEARHEMAQFEALVALVNLASRDEGTRARLVAGGAWGQAREACFSENALLQRTGVELLCNLVQCGEAIKSLQKTDLKILFLFAKSDDRDTVRAATTAIAFLSTLDNAQLIKKSHFADDLRLFQNLAQSCEDRNLAAMARLILENCK